MDLTLKLPAVIGRYRLEGEVASGGMATVYHGRMTGSSGYARTVAIKRMHPHCASDPEFVAMFLDEANLAARIRHPNVVPVLDIVNEGGSLIMVMEYVAGDTVERLLRSAKKAGVRPPHRIVTAIMAGALEGLHAAHEAIGDDGHPLNIVHRDVSPQNVIVGFDGIARVLDFGVAKATKRLQTTRAGQLKGRLRYMAPEQIRSRPVDRRADVYAASVVLWEALAGRPLFEADNEGAMMIKVLEGTVPSLRDVVPDMPPALELVLLKGLRPVPEDRYQTAREMATAVERAAGIATPREVADWVRRVVPAPAAQRAAMIAGLDLDAFGPEPLRDQVEGPIVPRHEPHVDQPEPPKRGKLWLTVFGLTVVAALVAFWIALHAIPGLGPALIDASRAVFGDRITNWIERVALTADAGWSDLWSDDERPEAYWNLPGASASASASSAPPAPSPFRPSKLQPMNPARFAEKDGDWMPVDAPEGRASPHAYRTALHPDVDIQQAVVRIVAFDARRTSVALAPGRDRDPLPGFPRAGLVAPSDADSLLAVIPVTLDAGYTARAGWKGVAGAMPESASCTVLLTEAGTVKIGTWSRLTDWHDGWRWFRSVPNCLVEDGIQSPGLDQTRAARRSALGVSADGKTLFALVGERISPTTMAHVIHYVGARHAASLGASNGEGNVYFHERFDADARTLAPMADSMTHDGLVGVAEPSPLDFLYVVRSAP